MKEPRFINPLWVQGAEMDPEEPEQFVAHRVPTHYRIRYYDRRWHRVYSRGFGKAYIVWNSVEWLLDDHTMKQLSNLVPTGPVANRVQEMQKPERAPEMKEGMTDEADHHYIMPTLGNDDDIPF